MTVTAPPLYRTGNVGATTAATVTVACPPDPKHEDGDLLVCAMVHYDSSVTVTAPEGWDTVGPLDGALRVWLFSKIANAEPNTWAFSKSDATTSVTWVIVAYESAGGIEVATGVEGTHIGVAPTYTSSLTLPSITTSTDHAKDIVVGTYTDPNRLTATGFTSRNATSGGLYVKVLDKRGPAEAGATGTAVLSISDNAPPPGVAVYEVRAALSSVQHDDSYTPPDEAPAHPSRPAAESGAKTVYAATDGDTNNAGTASSPWTLTEALNRELPGGSTILLRGGIYSGQFTLSDTNVTLQSCPGEWAWIESDAATGMLLTVTGEWCVVEQIGFRCTNTDRTTGVVEQLRCSGIFANANYIDVRNCVIVDVGDGVDTYAGHGAGNLYGNLVSDNGYSHPTRENGHCFYVQNTASAPTKTFRHNICVRPYEVGIKCGGTSALAGASNLEVAANTVVDCGGHNANGEPAISHYWEYGASANMAWTDNRVWNPNGYAFASYYNAATIYENMKLVGNWLVGAGGAQFTRLWKSITATGNTLAAPALVDRDRRPTQMVLADNSYYSDADNPFQLAGEVLDADGWLLHTGETATIHPAADLPAQVWVDVNAHEAGRAHVTVHNPTGAAAVDVDLDAVLSAGDTAWIYNAFNIEAGFVHRIDAYTAGGVAIPVDAATMGPNRTPAGLDAAATTWPTFGVFIVRTSATWVAPGTPPVPEQTAEISATPTSGVIPFDVTFTVDGDNVNIWSLDYGDGSDLDTGTDFPDTAVHTYTEAGSYTATLTTEMVDPDATPEPELEPTPVASGDLVVFTMDQWLKIRGRYNRRYLLGP